MNWKNWFKPPCEHNYEKVADLSADGNPDSQAVTMVRFCTKCGDTIERTFRAPDPCPPHRWKIHSEKELKNQWGEKRGVTLHVLRCETCGCLDEYKSGDE